MSETSQTKAIRLWMAWHERELEIASVLFSAGADRYWQQAQLDELDRMRTAAIEASAEALSSTAVPMLRRAA